MNHYPDERNASVIFILSFFVYNLCENQKKSLTKI